MKCAALVMSCVLLLTMIGLGLYSAYAKDMISSYAAILGAAAAGVLLQYSIRIYSILVDREDRAAAAGHYLDCISVAQVDISFPRNDRE